MQSCVVLTPHEKKNVHFRAQLQLSRHIGPFYHSTIVAATALQHYIPWTGANEMPLPPWLGPGSIRFFFLDVFTVPLEIDISSSSGEQRECPGWPGGGVARRADSNTRKVKPFAKKRENRSIIEFVRHSYRTGFIPAVTGFSSLVWEVELHCDKQAAHCWFYQGSQLYISKFSYLDTHGFWCFSCF